MDQDNSETSEIQTLSSGQSWKVQGFSSESEMHLVQKRKFRERTLNAFLDFLAAKFDSGLL